MTQRGRPRSGLIYSLRVREVGSHATLGLLVNLSATGLMLLGTAPVAEGSDLHMTISLPRVLALGDRVTARGTVAWCHAAESGGCYIGIRLVEIAEDASAAIDRLLQEYSELSIVSDQAGDPYLQALGPEDVKRLLGE